MRRLVLVAALLTLAGCSAPSNAPSAGADSAAARLEPLPLELTPTQQSGRAIYQTMCWTCHGLSGRGNGPAVKAGSMTPPPTFHTKDYATASATQLRQRFAASLEGADPNHPHMQFVASLLKPERFGDALSFVQVLAYPPEIPGSAFAGKAIYDYRCVGCHGKDGTGNGPAAASLVQMPPADFTTDTLLAARNWDALFQHVKEGGHQIMGSAMPPWGIVLTDEDIWDLVAYLGTFQRGVLSRPSWVK
jgi:cytochrome c oxidase cbb3-type subunit III